MSGSSASSSRRRTAPGSDLREHARELVAQMERDLNTRLEWAAIDHHNTDNPHLHVLVRGRDEQGRPLSIDRGYIQSGIRTRRIRLRRRHDRVAGAGACHHGHRRLAVGPAAQHDSDRAAGPGTDRAQTAT